MCILLKMSRMGMKWCPDFLLVRMLPKMKWMPQSQKLLHRMIQ